MRVNSVLFTLVLVICCGGCITPRDADAPEGWEHTQIVLNNGRSISRASIIKVRRDSVIIAGDSVQCVAVDSISKIQVVHRYGSWRTAAIGFVGGAVCGLVIPVGERGSKLENCIGIGVLGAFTGAIVGAIPLDYHMYEFHDRPKEYRVETIRKLSNPDN